MKIRHFIFFLFTLNATIVFGQEGSNSDEKPENRVDNITFFKPTIGAGVGILTFHGDIGSGSFKNHLTPRIGYNLLASARINDYLDFSLEALFGRLEVNERTIGRNLNFQSEIRSGGAKIYYNFGHLLPPTRLVEPFVSIGIESLEFLSKTDLLDAYGNQYHYWSDGSIRDLPEDHPNSGAAKYLQRDYKFETDIRESNFDGFGRYSERTFSMPTGIGFRMFLTDFLDFRMGTTMHFAFSNLIDGVTENSIGTRKGNSLNDRFLFTSFSISYRFAVAPQSSRKSKYDQSAYKHIDFAEFSNADSDNDGVLDFDDYCPDTPPGVPVDARGCPFDTDGDGIPDYKDKEPNTPKGLRVDKDGIALTEEAIKKLYQSYTDTTGQYSKIVHTKYEAHQRKPKQYYQVQLGVFDKGISPDLINKFLSLPDVSSSAVNDSLTAYNVGIYTDYKDAASRKTQVINAGINNAKIIMVKDGLVYEEGQPGFVMPYVSVVPDKKQKPADNKPIFYPTKTDAKTGKGTKYKHYTNETLSENDPQGEVVFRLQLGAFSKRPNMDSFGALDDIIAVTSEDGMTRVMTGSYTDINQAARAKANVMLKGFNEAFIVAYKNGQRVSITTVGATLAPVEAPIVVNKSDIKFKVQIGAFKNDLPADLKMVFNSLDNPETQKTNTGLTRYLAGSYASYQQALELKTKLASQHGLNDAFIVAFYKGQMIPVQEALELLK